MIDRAELAAQRVAGRDVAVVRTGGGRHYVEARRDGRSVVYEIIDDDVRRIMRLGERYLDENDERIRSCRVIARETARRVR